MKTTNNWGINFPDNPYEGQIFYYPHTQDTFTYVVPKNQSGSGEWVWLLIRTLLQTATNKSFFTIS